MTGIVKSHNNTVTFLPKLLHRASSAADDRSGGSALGSEKGEKGKEGEKGVQGEARKTG